MKNIAFIIILCLSATVAGAQGRNNNMGKPEKKAPEIVVSKGEPVKDIDGNVYSTIVIGNQTWMVENLRTTRYRNGDPILTTNPATLDVSSQEKINPLVGKDLSTPAQIEAGTSDDQLPKYQWAYQGDEANALVYGRLYTWYAVADKRNICPEGWHVSTDKEWTILIDYLGGNATAGGLLKETGTAHWADPNGGATNQSGFTALPAGGRNTDGSFSNQGKYGAWWTSSPGVYRHIEHDDPYTYRNYYYNSKLMGYSVRCIKD